MPSALSGVLPLPFSPDSLRKYLESCSNCREQPGYASQTAVMKAPGSSHKSATEVVDLSISSKLVSLCRELHSSCIVSAVRLPEQAEGCQP